MAITLYHVLIDFESTIYLLLITELPACNFIFAAATTTLVKPTMYHHMTTSTAIVETTLHSTTQPVATEHAIPTSTQSHLPLVIGKNQLPQYCYYYRVCTHRVQTPISAYMVHIYIKSQKSFLNENKRM